MKKLRFFLAVLLALVESVTCHAQRVSDLTRAAAVDTNDLISLSQWTGSGWQTRSIAFTNLLNSVITNTLAAQHVNARDYVNLWTAVASNKPVRFLLVGDSVAEAVETVRGVKYAFDGWMERGGYGNFWTLNPSGGPGGNLPFYVSSPHYWNNPDYSPGMVVGMEDSDTITTVSNDAGHPKQANLLQLCYHAGAELGSMLVETQHVGGTWGTRATINATLGSAGQLIATNFVLAPTTNYLVRISSTGSNNIAALGLLNTTETNTHSWAKMAVSGGLLKSIVQQAGFWTFLTNYNPQVIFVEAKDPVADLLEGLDWFATHCTNRDVVVVANSPNIPDAGAENARAETIRWGLRKKVNVFDKFALLTPTNLWHTTPGIWADGAHLGYRGITYISTAFADWFGVGASRFAHAGLRPFGGDISGKANLTGGNTFSGVQVNTGNLVVTNTQLTLRGAAANTELQIWDPVGNSQLVRYKRRADAEILSTVWSAAGTASMFTVTNNSGVTYVTSDSPYGLNFGTSGRDWYHFRTNTAPADTATVDAWLPVKGTNGTTYFLPAYQ
jgi:hypothetical protein